MIISLLTLAKYAMNLRNNIMPIYLPLALCARAFPVARIVRRKWAMCAINLHCFFLMREVSRLMCGINAMRGHCLCVDSFLESSPAMTLLKMCQRALSRLVYALTDSITTTPMPHLARRIKVCYRIYMYIMFAKCYYRAL